MNRRKFLHTTARATGSALLAASPLQLFLTQVLSGMFRRAAMAAPALDASSLKKNLTILLSGSPPRHLFDSALRPFGSGSDFVSHPTDPKFSMLGTKVIPDATGGNQHSTVHETFEFQGIHLPTLWQGLMPTTGGGSAPMTELAKNWCGIRGVHSIDNHFLGGLMHLVPVTGGYSLSGSFADSSPCVFPAAGVGSNGFFKSRKGKTFTPISSPTSTMSPLKATFSNYQLTRPYPLRMTEASVSEQIDHALDLMKAHSSVLKGRAPETYEHRLTAKRLILTQFGDLNARYNELYLKYEELIRRSFNEAALRLQGVDKFTIAGSATAPFEIMWHGFPKTYYTGQDLETEMLGDTVTIDRLASGMAITEFMLTEGADPIGYTSSMDLVLGSGIINSGFSQISKSGVLENNFKGAMINDAHNIGAISQIFIFSRYYRALAACIYELTRALRAKTLGLNDNLFNHTVIGLAGEFGRDPYDSGNLMGHGETGGTYSLFSGMIDHPMVVGDIKINGGSGTRSTWGAGAPISQLSNQVLTPAHVHASITNLMGLTPPVTTYPSILYKDSEGKVQSLIGAPKNV
jgi:hypothetical protein